MVGPLISCCPLNIGRPPDQPDLGTCEQQGILHHPAPLMLRSNSRVSDQINNGPLIGQYNLLVQTVGHILHVEHSAQCAFWVLRWPCGQNGPVYATGPYYVAHVVDTGP